MDLKLDDVRNFTNYTVTARDRQQVQVFMLKVNKDQAQDFGKDVPVTCFQCGKQGTSRTFLPCPISYRSVGRWSVYDGLFNFCCYEEVLDYLEGLKERSGLVKEYANSIGLLNEMFSKSYPGEKLHRAEPREVRPILTNFQQKIQHHPRKPTLNMMILPCVVIYWKEGGRFVSQGIIETLTAHENSSNNLEVDVYGRIVTLV